MGSLPALLVIGGVAFVGCVLLAFVETQSLFEGIPDLWSKGRSHILRGCSLFGIAGLVVYYLLLVSRDPSHIGLGAAPDMSLALAAIGTVQLGRIQLGGHAYQLGESAPGQSLYDRSLHHHMVAVYRHLLGNMTRDHQVMTIRTGLLKVYEPQELADQFEGWATTKQSDQAAALALYLRRTVDARNRSDTSKKKAMVGRLIDVDLDGARHVLSRKASDAVRQRAW